MNAISYTTVRQILLLFPNLVPELANIHPSDRFRISTPVVKSVERCLDGLLLSESDDPSQPLIFVEAQMQPSANLYRCLLSQLSTYLAQYTVARHWQTVVIHPDRQVERPAQSQVTEALNLTAVYLSELEDGGSEGLGCLRLVSMETDRVPAQAAALIERVRANPALADLQGQIVQLISSIVTWRSPHLSEQEIHQLLGLAPVERTKPFQEGQTEKAREIAGNLLQEGMQLADIARVTGLAAGEIPVLELQK